MEGVTYQLVVRKGPKPDEVFLLEQTPIIVGRDPMSDVVLNDPEVSRNHCRLIQTPDGYEIQDMGSTNGTFIDGRRLRGEPKPLTDGNILTLGSNVSLLFRTAGQDDPLATMVTPSKSNASSSDSMPPVRTGQIEAIREDEGITSAVSELPPAAESQPRADEDYSRTSGPAPPPVRPPTAPNIERPAAQPPPPPEDKRRRYLIIAAVALLLLCCCCLLIIVTVAYLQNEGIIPPLIAEWLLSGQV